MDYITEEFERLKIEENLKRILYYKEPKFHSLEWGMNYITFSPSKRVRPLLLLESNLIFNTIDDDSYILASALELIHTYSLVHDDLPCMDNDDLRRGQKTLHKIKSESYAVLVGDALLTRVFEILSLYTKVKNIPSVLKYFHKKSGETGMIYGQVLDIDGEGKNLEIEAINEINEHKTGKLLELSLILGGINGGASENDIDILEKLGIIIGHIFQLQDDILDIVGDKNIMGKNTGSDEKKEKSSIPLLLGIDKTKEIIKDYKENASDIIEKFTNNRDFFYKFIDFLVTRVK
ncbi:MAG TPA: polyprenyl synthetase family protein [Spirochaetota bacterium]|nr:polyprenyl synthetase family protein [Spirochaetota bacterium]